MALRLMSVKEVLEKLSSGKPDDNGFIPVFHTWEGKLDGNKLVIRTRSGAYDRARNPRGEFEFPLSNNSRKGVIMFKNTTGKAYCYFRSPQMNWEGRGFVPGPFPGMMFKVVLYVEGGYQCGGKWKGLSVNIVQNPSAVEDPVWLRCVWRCNGGWYGVAHESTNWCYGPNEIMTVGDNPQAGIPRERAEAAAELLGVTPELLVATLAPFLEHKLEEAGEKDLSRMTKPNSSVVL